MTRTVFANIFSPVVSISTGVIGALGSFDMCIDEDVAHMAILNASGINHQSVTDTTTTPTTPSGANSGVTQITNASRAPSISCDTTNGQQIIAWIENDVVKARIRLDNGTLLNEFVVADHTLDGILEERMTIALKDYGTGTILIAYLTGTSAPFNVVVNVIEVPTP